MMVQHLKSRRLASARSDFVPKLLATVLQVLVTPLLRLSRLMWLWWARFRGTRADAIRASQAAWQDISNNNLVSATLLGEVAIAADSTWPDGYRVLALARRRLGNVAVAREIYERGALRCPDAKLLADWGDLELDEGMSSAAEELYRRGLALDTTSSWLSHRLGVALVRRGALEEAEALLQSAHASAPSDGRILVALGMTRAKRGDWNGAKQTLLDATTANPDDAFAHYQFALVLADLGSWQETLQHARKAEELATDEMDFRRLRQAAETQVSRSESARESA